MKRLIAVLMLIVFIIPASVVSAQSNSSTEGSVVPGTWVTSINIQNPSTNTDAAIVTISFYDNTGKDVLDFSVSPTIPVGGSRSLYVPSDVIGLGTGQFSAVISSNVPVESVVNMSSTSPYTGDSYVGIPAGSNTLYFPGLYNNYYGFSAQLILQDADSTTASVSIQFYNQSTGAAVGSPYTDTIDSNVSKVYVLSQLTPALSSGNANGLLSATVTSTGGKIVGVADVWSSAVNGEFASYNSFSEGNTTVYVPALYVNYFNFGSALTVQNIGTVPTAVTVTFSNGQTETDPSLAAGAAVQWYLPSTSGVPTGNANGVFSAKVVSTGTGGNAAQNVVAMVTTEDKVKGSLASYTSLQGGTGTVLCPVTLKSFYQWFSSETVQNVGNNPTDITITYPGGYSKTVQNVPANGTVNFIELSNTGSVLPDGSSLAATITSSGENIVAVVQENSNTRYAANNGDYLFSYSCVNK